MTQPALAFDTPYTEHAAALAATQARLASLTPRDAGMACATDKADAAHDGWSEQAFRFLLGYAGTHALFAGWQVLEAAAARQAVPVANGKAWGSVFVRAAKAGAIRKVGYTPDPHRHDSPAPLWQSQIVQEPR